MEIIDANVQIEENLDSCVKEKDGRIPHGNEITTAQQFCTIEIKEAKAYSIFGHESIKIKDKTCNTCDINTINTIGTFYSSSFNEEVREILNENSEIFTKYNDQMQSTNYNISTFTIPSDLLNSFNINIKRKYKINPEELYTSGWLCDISENNLSDEKIPKTYLSKVQIKDNENAKIDFVEEPKTNIADNLVKSDKDQLNNVEKPKKQNRLKQIPVQGYKEKLRRRTGCMRDKRKKSYEQESEEQRLQRLAKEAARRREMRMYYETPEQKRKRLDAEAARKREYRMYNETPEDKRKRLDREAERRRAKRLALYANESLEQRRERLNKESAKRREARLNQYAKETEEQRKERLRRDAIRARETRFTRSSLETEEERRQRLIKDALRKREVRMHEANLVGNNFTELKTVQNFEELNNSNNRDNPDNQLNGQYLSNWVMWFHNTLNQPVHAEEITIEQNP